MKLTSQVLACILTPLMAVSPLWSQSSLHIQAEEADGVSAQAGTPAAGGITVKVTDEAGSPVADAAIVVRMPDSGATAVFTDGSHSAIVYTDQSGSARVSGFTWSAMPGSVAVRVTATKGVLHAGMLLEETVNGAASVAPAIQAAREPKPVEPVVQPGVTAQKQTADPIRVPRPASAVAAEPQVSVTNGPTHEKVHSGGSSKKWIILALVAAGAGAGIALAGHGKSSSSTPTTGTTSTNVGTPTITVGAP